MSGNRIRGWCCDNCRWDMISPGRYLKCPNCDHLVRQTTLKEVTDRRKGRSAGTDRDG